MDKNTINRTFNTLFFQLVEDIIKINPDQTDIIRAQLFFQEMKKQNPTLLLKIWKKHVYEPFQEQIDQEDITFFITKEYDGEVSKMNGGNENAIHMFIENMKLQLHQMHEEDSMKIMKEIKMLSQLSAMYCG